MEIIHPEYFLEIAKEKGLAKASETLCITQSALTQYLTKLENDIGTPLFYRTRGNWQLTPAGEIYADGALQIQMIEKETSARISDSIHRYNEKLNIAFNPGRGIRMFSAVYPQFHKIHPEITVTPMEVLGADQNALLKSGQIDIGFQLLREQDFLPELHYQKLHEEEIYLIIPDEKAGMLPSSSDPVSLSRFIDEPFALIYKRSTLRPFLDEIFAGAGFAPHILMETYNNTTICGLVRSGMCCGLVPGYYLNSEAGFLSAPVEGHPSWFITAVSRKKGYLSNPARTFIRLVRAYWSNIGSNS